MSTETQRVDELAARLRETPLSAEEQAELDALLLRCPEARRRFVEHMLLENDLREDAAALFSEPVTVSSSPKWTRWLSWRPLTAAAALAACFVLGCVWLVLSRPSPAMEDTTASVAVLTRGLNLDWESAAIAPGTPLSPGLLKLRSGIAQIEFYQGAGVLIEGPAEFQLVSSGEATCTRGKLSANVPSQARGFRINTPKGTIVDLGTEFGLDVSESNAEVHVFKGEVELHQAAESVKSLKEGQAMAFAAKPQPLAANAASFASLGNLDSRTALSDRAHFERWRSASERRHADPALKLHFDFQDAATTRTLRNHAPQGQDGSIVGAAWTMGRWPGKGALDFRNVSDRVRVTAPAEVKALTMAAWVRVSGLDRTFNSLFMSEGWRDRRVHWQIMRDGRLLLGIAGPTGQVGEDCNTEVFFTPERFGRWMHLAVTFDPQRKEVRHYTNGVLFAKTPLRDTSPLKPGVAELGNWNDNNNGGPPGVAIRHLSGTMDEFSLWDRVLSEAEIQALAE